MARDFDRGFEIAVYARTVYVRRVVEREGVIKFLPAVARRQASTPPLLATSATSNGAAVGSDVGAVWRPRPAYCLLLAMPIHALAQNLADDVAGDVGEAEVAAQGAIGQFGVVDAEEVQHRCGDIVDV